MRVSRIRTFLVIGAASLAIAAVALAHGGGLDANGGHNDRKNGGYHFHRGPLAGQYFSSKAEAMVALKAHEAQQRAPKKEQKPARLGGPANADATIVQQVEAMRHALITKGVLTEQEYAEAIDHVLKAAKPG